jgi:hypothetical protein
MLKFSRRKLPQEFYVYLYCREDGTPYYCGKGYGPRAWRKHGFLHVPKDESRIKIVAHNLTESESFCLEVKLIKHYGRKDLGTGILNNRTYGGEGTRGTKWSEESRNRITGRKTGRTKDSFTEEWKQNISNAKKGVTTWNKGIPISEDQKRRQSETRKSKNGQPGFNIRPPCKPSAAKASSEKQKGRKFIYSPTLQQRKPIPPNELDKYLQEGWVLGQGPRKKKSTV